MNNLVTPFDKLILEAGEIQRILELPIIADDVNEVVQKGSLLVEYQSRSGKMLADAKYHLNNKMKSEVLEIMRKLLGKGFSAQAQNALVHSIAKDERMLVDWLDRINSACTHQIDWCRTLISKAKEEMKMAGYFNNQ
jgi:maltooligosyltrehalose synthase